MLLSLLSNKFALYGIIGLVISMVFGFTVLYYKSQINSLNEKVTEQYSTIRTLNANIAILNGANLTNQKTIELLKEDLNVSNKMCTERLVLKDEEISTIKKNLVELTRKINFKEIYKYDNCTIKFKEGNINENDILSDIMRIGS